MTPLVLITDSVEVEPNKGRYRTTTTDVMLYWFGVLIDIPEGFRFDGASLPFSLWWWVHPWDWWVVLAACVHDFCYRFKLFTRYECDRIFLRILIKSARKSRWKWLAYKRIKKARIMYRAVRIWGASVSGGDW